MIDTLFLAWQDPEKRRWYPIGRLSSNGRRFVFVYTGGAQDAQLTGRFSPIASFPDLRAVYQSDEIFPLFANRLMRPSRPDYARYLDWLALENVASPLTVLARSGGQRVTDNIELFPGPQNIGDGVYETWFFLHGLSHTTRQAAQRAETLTAGEPLLVMWDFQNPHDPEALAVRSAEQFPGDMHLLGYCPRYLRGEVIKLMTSGDNIPSVTVERVNLSPAPIQLRVLCKLRMKWTAGFEPFSGPEYQPLVRCDENVLRVA